ncbi:MAG TPA: diphthine synthase, partial [Thermoplasmata archaeon]|nr:diphthine synthase [Thermoplasmata archaeon]
MAELAFVGLGLGDERGVTERGRAVLASSDVVFAEEYTAVAPAGTLDRLAQVVGKPIQRLDRPLLESEGPILEALARHARVALVVVGDPFAATTHVALRLAAEKAGHSWSYCPNASILTAAAGLLGLIHYRFGRTVSLPLPSESFVPTSPLEHIAANRLRDLHTLVLLDLRPEEGRFLTARNALDLIRERDPQEGFLADSDRVAVVARVGQEDAQAWVGSFSRLRSVDFGPPMHAIVVLAPNLHFEEEAALDRYVVPDEPK